jgi:hypothetical protein
MNEDRKQNLTEFVAWVGQHLTGDEKGEAQIFLDRLFKAFELKGVREAGATLEMRVKKRDEGGTAFADLVYKPIVLIEMKKRGTDLRRHYRQAFDYWVQLAPNRPKYVVLCNFDEFWIYDFDSAQYDEPLDKLPLSELPNRWGPLAFLFRTRDRPTFGNDHEAVTREAAHLLAECFGRLIIRGIERPLAQRFILQMLVALFAEDIDLLPKYFVTQLLEDCKSKADSYDLLGGLFVAMNTRGKAQGGRYKGVDYFNGGLFAEPARVELEMDELAQLRGAATKNWSMVRPEIFGTLFEHSIDTEERHAFGAHFTHPVDIMKIVGPTIVEPWRESIGAAKNKEELRKLIEQMAHYTVLDPACGSGNFLYVAYRELKRLEAQVAERLQGEGAARDDSTQRRFGFVTARQFYGLDVNPFAVELAKVTMMIARKLAIDELHISEQPLPLDNLDDNFLAVDSLVGPDGKAARWPSADVIIGNPPFLDARKMTMEHGRQYVAILSDLYPDVPRRADYCTYWLRKAHDHLPACESDNRLRGRAGLVGTQNIRNNEAREGGLDYIVKTGTVVEAVENQPWSGEANVNVSIVNWVKSHDPKVLPASRRLWYKVEPAGKQSRSSNRRSRGSASKTYDLAFREPAFINAALSDETDVTLAKRLTCCFRPKVVFEGVQTGHDGFVIGEEEALRLLRKNDAYHPYIKPFINGTDLISGRYVNLCEYVVDLSDLDMLQASSLPDLIAIPRNRVLADWKNNASSERQETGKESGEHQNRLDAWWALKRPRGDLQATLRALPRYIACSAVMKRPTFVFLNASYLPTNALKAFAFADDYSFGVLQSGAHWKWFVTKCSKLTERFRYTPESVFDTFAWPQSPTGKHIEAVAEAGRAVRKVRAENLPKIKGGLRALYRTLELPGANPLKDAHAELDAAVLAAYGFSAKKDLLAQLLELNLDVARRIDAGETVVAPGIPPDYPHPKKLVTDDCIQPRPLSLV